MFMALVTVAMNCCVAPRMTVAVLGKTATVTAGMLNVIVMDLLGSACETALTEAVAGVASMPGAE